MQQRRAGSLECVPNTVTNRENEEGKKVAGFLFLLANLIVDQSRLKQALVGKGQTETNRFGKTLTDELGECMIHLIRKAKEQGIEIPIVTTRLQAGKRQKVSVREAGRAGYYWVDVCDTAAIKPLTYSIMLNVCVNHEEGGGL